MIKIDEPIKSFKIVDETDYEEKIIPDGISLPDDAPARMKVLKSEGKKWYLTIVYEPETHQPFALFAHTNANEKTASTSNAVDLLTALALRKGIGTPHIESTLEKCKSENNVGKLTRTISLLLRHGVAIKNVVKELDKVEDLFIGSFLFQIKKFLSQYIKDGEEVEDENCQDCGGVMVYSEGCMMCSSCGSSKCQ